MPAVWWTAALDPSHALPCFPPPAVAALSVVTLGVAYLSFTSWNDTRTEAADRARFDSSSFRPSRCAGQLQGLLLELLTSDTSAGSVPGGPQWPW